jgi:hypothetical protein
MSGKTDYRNYINPGPKGSRFTANWQAEFLPDGETYVENKTGKVIDAAIDSVRPGSVVRVRRLFCMAPWKGSPRKRREAIAARVQAIRDRKGHILEAETGRTTAERGGCAKMLMGAYEDIATAGRAVAKGRTGRPPKYEFTPAEWEVIEGIWTSRKFANDGARLAAIEKRLGRVPGRTLIRNKLGSPHKGRE